MAKHQTERGALVYPAMAIIVDEAWHRDGSVFTPGAAVWTAHHLDQIDRHFAQRPDVGARNFLEKLRDQLEPCEPAAVQLMAEILYVHLVIQRNVTGATKRRQIHEVWSWSGLDNTLPAVIDASLDGGLINPGQWYATRRDLQLGYLVKAGLAWRTLDQGRRDELLADPWGFGAWADGVDPSKNVSPQRNALLYIVHPDAFEDIVSNDHKEEIVKHWNEHAPADGTVDQKLFAIRTKLSATLGDDIHWYSDDLKPLWHAAPVVKQSVTSASPLPLEITDEAPRRQARYELMVRAWEEDEVALADFDEAVAAEERDATLLDALVHELAATADLGAFVERIGSISSVNGRVAVRNFWAHVQKRIGASPAGTARIAALVGRPLSDDDASRRIDELESLMRDAGAVQQFVGASGMALAALWTRGLTSDFPEFYENAESVAAILGWLDPKAPNSKITYWQLLRELDPERPRRAASVLSWARTHFSGLDATLGSRCDENARLISAAGSGYDTPAAESKARFNIDVVKKDLDLAGKALQARIAAALGRPMGRPHTFEGLVRGKGYRADMVFEMRALEVEPGIDFRVWITRGGVFVGLWPVWKTDRETMAVANLLRDVIPDGFEHFAWIHGTERLDPVGSSEAVSGSFLIGRRFDLTEALDRPEFGEQVVRVAAEAAVLFDRVASAAVTRTGEPRDDEPEDDPNPIDHLQAAADDLLIHRSYLEEIVELLHEKGKGQVILYGPPGTGKTFLARRLAQALVEEDEERWRLVQFHPSTSYEDFFEGYRPVVDKESKAMGYELQLGPLATIAEAAAADPLRRYVLVIDEINRANLPKVFGELLYLLEYRDQPVRSLYRPDRDFRLPDNLYFIGTMNTADRSIGLVDAAMRRRFRFVGFFPDTEPMASLLDRWLGENDGSSWVSALVAEVNEELAEALGRDLQLGPSFFMVTGIDETALARVWKHSVQPFIEDQFFGDQSQIDRFSWDRVWERHGPSTAGLDEAVDEP